TGHRRMPPGAWKGAGAEEANADVPIASLEVISRLRPKRRFTGNETPFLKANAPGPWKITMPSPTVQMNMFDPGKFEAVYSDRQRSGGFEPLRFLPKGKIVVLGLVTTKLGSLEDQETLMRRVDEAATYAPLEQLALSPQCGFASTYLGNLLSEDDEKRKLALV